MGKKTKNKQQKKTADTAAPLNNTASGRPYPGRRGWLAALVVASLTLIVYLPALNNKFVNWDDIGYVTGNQNIQSVDSEFFKWIFSFNAGNWHPLTWVSHALDYSIWGLNPLGHHLTSIVLHSANVFLLCILFIYLVLNTQQPQSFQAKERIMKKALIAGAAASLLFGIIPVHVESVAWVSERKDVLSTFFFLTALISYTRYCTEQHINKPLYYASTLISFILALMSKPMVITLPVILVLLDIYPFRRINIKKALAAQYRVFVEKIPFFLLSLASGVVTVMAQQAGGAIATIEEYPFSGRLIIALRAILLYLAKTIVPAGLSPVYPYQKKVSYIPYLSFEFLGPLFAVLLISFFCIYAWKKGWKSFLTAWAFYIATLLPVLGLIKVGNQAAAERYTYIPSMGPLFLIGLGLALLSDKIENNRQAFSRNKAAVFLPLILFFIFMGGMTIKQTGVWKDSTTLWTAAIRKFPTLPFAYTQRGTAFMFANKYSEALEDFNHSIKLNDNDAAVYINRAFIYKENRNYQNALSDLNRAIQIDPKMTDSYYNRAVVYIKIEEYSKALEDLAVFFNLTQGKDIDLTKAYYSRAFVYIRLGDYNKAIADLNSFIEKAPAAEIRKSKVYHDRAAAYMKTGKYHEAIRDYSKAISIDPKEVKAYYYRGKLYSELGQFQKAVDDFSEIIKLSPDNYEAYNNRGAIYSKIGRNNEAASDLKEAKRLSSNKQ